MVDFAVITDKLVENVILYLPKLVFAILTLVIGLWIIKILVKVLNKQMTKKKVDVSLQGFLKSLMSISLKILLFITVISMFGVQMTSFIAVLGAAGLAIGLALQGSLANFAGGVLILLFKPYKVGDYIDAQGHAGSVMQIQIFSTVLKTPQNVTIVIPNGPLSNGSITNYSTEAKRRLDMTFGIGYGDSITKAKKVLKEIIAKEKRIIKTPAPQILLSELADSSVNFQLRLWCKGSDLWDLNFFLNEKVKKEFDKNKISIPFPQQDVHIYNEK